MCGDSAVTVRGRGLRCNVGTPVEIVVLWKIHYGRRTCIIRLRSLGIDREFPLLKLFAGSRWEHEVINEPKMCGGIPDGASLWQSMLRIACPERQICTNTRDVDLVST